MADGNHAKTREAIYFTCVSSSDQVGHPFEAESGHGRAGSEITGDWPRILHRLAAEEVGLRSGSAQGVADPCVEAAGRISVDDYW